MPKLVADSKQLELALLDFEKRNFLIEELNVSDANPISISKLILSCWLGNTTSLVKLREFDVLNNAAFTHFIYVGYYCLLSLDKHISLLAEQSAAFKVLHDCRFKIIDWYNHHYFLFQEKFISTLHACFNPLRQSNHPVIKKVFAECLSYLSKPLPNNHEVVDITNVTNNTFFHAGSFNSTYIAVETLKLITFSRRRLPFYQFLPQHNDCQINNLLIKADDGMFLDGLFIRGATSSSEEIVIALVGHFSTEKNYIAEKAYSFYKGVFGTDIVFVNPRNYAKRSARLADNIERIAADVLCFVHYFQDRKIVLYGMCGGTGPMIIAADMLIKKGGHCKLIVDRFSKEYANFFDTKTITRGIQLNSELPKEHPYLAPVISFSLKTYLLSPIQYLLKGLITMAKSNIDFAQIVRQLPEEDVLILEVRSKKENDATKQVITDLAVHPENNIRKTIKDKRHHHRALLKNLYDQSKAIFKVDLFSEIGMIFYFLSSVFRNCLELIDNEKLINLFPIDRNVHYENLHGTHLFELNPRHHHNNMFIHQFIGGFFKKPIINWRGTLDQFIHYPTEMIEESLQENYSFNNEKTRIFSEKISQFLLTISTHKNYLYHIMTRTMTSKMYEKKEIDCYHLFRDLLSMPLFVFLANRHREIDSMSLKP